MNAAVGLLSRGASGFRTGWPAFRFAFGPGALVAVGYMDPGNWATDISAGSNYGYDLLAVVLIASLMAMLLQGLSVRLGIATGQDLAQACRTYYSRRTTYVLWGLCQIAIVACDMAEIIGTAIALNLLFGVPLLAGVCIGAFATLMILLLEQKGRRRLEAVIVVLSLVVGVCIFIDVVLAQPSTSQAFAGLVPSTTLISDPGKLLLSVGIIGATVMPHNLYLHSALVIRNGEGQGTQAEAKRTRIKWATVDSCIALTAAFFVNAGILILAAAAFQTSGNPVSDLRDAYHLLTPLLGTSIASILFGLALFAAGQNSTVTATMAGGIVAQGFLGLRLNPWVMRLVTRGSALIPAVLVIVILGEASLTQLLVLSQVVLSLQLPFAVVPLVQFCSRRSVMGALVAPLWLKVAAIAVAAFLIVLDVALLANMLGEIN
jgi:manganese transport protein